MEQRPLAYQLSQAFKRHRNLMINKKSVIEHISRNEMLIIMAIFELKHQKDYVIANDIANELQLSKPTITQYVTKLEQKGYVERKLNQDNRREYFLELSPDINEIIKNKSENIKKDLESIVAYLGEKKVIDLIETINDICDYEERKREE